MEQRNEHTTRIYLLNSKDDYPDPKSYYMASDKTALSKLEQRNEHITRIYLLNSKDDYPDPQNYIPLPL